MYSRETEEKARQDLIEVARLCYQRGYICGMEGNFSIKLDEERILTTPSGTCKARIEPSDLIITDLEGKPVCASTVVSGNASYDSSASASSSIKSNADSAARNSRKPSTEIAIHLTAYKSRPDAKAVVHAHPTTAVGFTVAGMKLDKCVLPEVVCTLGRIPVAPYATPSTGELSDSIADIVGDHDAVVLDHHGALTIGNDIWDAYYKMETLEHYAQTMLVAHMLGDVQPLKSSQVEKLLDICGVYGLQKPRDAEFLLSPACSSPDGD